MWSLADQLAALDEYPYSNTTVGLSQLSERFGIRYFAVLHCCEHSQSIGETVVVNNWPPDFLTRVKKMPFLTIADMVNRSTESVAPFFWHPSSQMQNEPDDLAQHHLDFMEETEMFSGLIIPAVLKSVNGLVVFAGLTKTLDQSAIATLHHAGLLAFEDCCQKCQSQVRTQIVSPLEHECISRISLGETVSEIGSKLGLSECAVCMVLDSAASKLDAANQGHMIAIALRKGIIG